ncbi:hypothetical protein LEP1GSC161_3043 [Leptospira santarosai str. CBC1416]|uniref:Uncharacterized protein n=1 Tax=Leptospira santarosai str. CBC1416 TaxID=1193059 RepID=M6VNE8_9LEPT|nr:hypothetical protein LEP1GSC165_1893 [Leptospira santarosai str. CBC523]EMO56666.1 hypothetical protein LEP1GSC161_3043 [Leptospira santarosai str. CBC1416]
MTLLSTDRSVRGIFVIQIGSIAKLRKFDLLLGRMKMILKING